jgi:hypothetical protein
MIRVSSIASNGISAWIFLEKGTPTLTANNQMTPKLNLALNAEIESSGRAANSARCARAISFALPQPRSSRIAAAAMSPG